MGKCGRTWRRRIKTRTQSSIKETRPKVLLDPEYIMLLRWAKRNGVDFGNLRPAVFHDTGRGMLATRQMTSQNCIISVPEKLLVRPQTVRESSLGKYLEKTKIFYETQHRVSTKLLLCLFLLYERYRQENSFWFPYIRTLPAEFNTPCYFNGAELKFLPNSCREQCINQVKAVQQDYEELQILFGKILSEFDGRFWRTVTLDSFKWAWCVVNTRSVYLSGGDGKLAGRGQGSRDGSYALAPVLDLLNHTDTAEICAKFNSSSQRYEIHTITEYNKGSQVFISYGPHDNAKLVLEYGFLLPKNIHNCYKFSAATVLSVALRPASALSRKRREIIEKNGLKKDLSCVEYQGISWSLRTLLGVLALSELELDNWDVVLSGDFISLEHHNQVNKWIGILLGNELEKLGRETRTVYSEVERMGYKSDNLELALQLRQQEKHLLEQALHLSIK